MTAIIPRWEWRTFGSGFRQAEAVFATLEPTDVQESDEIYLLTDSGSNVKIRYNLLDIKEMREVSDAGLEQWIPVMKAEFPLPAATVTEVFRELHKPVPALERSEYTLQQFLDELVGTQDQVIAVDVHKRRVRYNIGGCTSEFTTVTAGDRTTQTIAVESPDAAAVLAAVQSLGLADYVNTNYGRGLADLVADRLPRFAIIDVGTNSVKFHIGERAADGSWATVVDRAEVTRLGEGLEQTGAIADTAADRTAEAIASMVAETRGLRCVAIVAVGTAALRIADNAADVVETIRARSGVTVKVISGEDEARLAYLAVRAGLPTADGSLVVFDTGGGSSQFTYGDGDRVDERFSVNVGAVSYTERFGLSGVVTPGILAAARAALAADLSLLDERPQPDRLAAMGGAITNLTAVSYSMAHYDPDVIQGTTLQRAEIERQIELYRTTPLDERRGIVGLQPKRADVILAGACIVATIMDKLGRDALIVSDRGLRHGLLVERFGV